MNTSAYLFGVYVTKMLLFAVNSGKAKFKEKSPLYSEDVFCVEVSTLWCSVS